MPHNFFFKLHVLKKTRNHASWQNLELIPKVYAYIYIKKQIIIMGFFSRIFSAQRWDEKQHGAAPWIRGALHIFLCHTISGSESHTCISSRTCQEMIKSKYILIVAPGRGSGCLSQCNLVEFGDIFLHPD